MVARAGPPAAPTGTPPARAGRRRTLTGTAPTSRRRGREGRVTRDGPRTSRSRRLGGACTGAGARMGREGSAGPEQLPAHAGAPAVRGGGRHVTVQKDSIRGGPRVRPRRRGCFLEERGAWVSRSSLGRRVGARATAGHDADDTFLLTTPHRSETFFFTVCESPGQVSGDRARSPWRGPGRARCRLGVPTQSVPRVQGNRSQNH